MNCNVPLAACLVSRFKDILDMLVVLSELRSAKVPLSSSFEFQAEKKNAFSARTVSTHICKNWNDKIGAGAFAV